MSRTFCWFFLRSVLLVKTGLAVSFFPFSDLIENQRNQVDFWHDLLVFSREAGGYTDGAASYLSTKCMHVGMHKKKKKPRYLSDNGASHFNDEVRSGFEPL